MTDTAVIFDIIARDFATTPMSKVTRGLNRLTTIMISAAGLAAGAAIKMAADFQTQMNRVVTGAGESEVNLQAVSAGILKMAGDVGQSTQALAAALYTIESGGYHGAAGLKVLQAAAEGAKVGNAELATVGDAVTTVLNAYRLSADQAVNVTNALIGAESQGKTNMEALAGSLANVLPVAAAAHVGLNEVLGAISTMTAEGTPAANATTYLRQTIGMLSNPSGKAADEMKALGLSAVQVGMNLGKNGLASTLTLLTDAIQRHMGPAGTVLIDKLKSASSSATAFQKVLANLNPTEQTYVGALATMVGGTKSMQAALELTGPNMAVFRANTAGIAQHVQAAGGQIEGWARVQTSFNQQMAEFRGRMEALGITIGQKLIPYAAKFASVLQVMVNFGVKNKAWVVPLVGALLTMAVTIKTIIVVTRIWTAAQVALDAAMDANPVGAIILGITLLVAGIIYAWKHFAWFRTAVRDTWAAIKVAWAAIEKASIWLWHHVLVPMGEGIAKAAKAIGAAAMWLWHNALEPAWKGISTVTMWLWHNVVEPAFKGVSIVAKLLWQVLSSMFHLWMWGMKTVVAPVVLWLWHNVVEPAWHGIATVALWLWHNVLDPVWHGIVAGVKIVAGIMLWLHTNVIGPVWDAISKAFSVGWNWVKGIFDDVMSVVHKVGHVFGDVFSAIGGFIASAFSGAVGIVKGAINGIIGLLNDAIGFLNRNLIDKVNRVPGVNFPRLVAIPKLDTGGTILQTGIAVVHKGETVVPAGSSSAGGGQRVVTVQGGDAMWNAFLAEMRRQVRTKYGGDVLVALGPTTR